VRVAPAACLLELLFALATASHASDGALEINQACATSATGCFPGDAGGFPVEITATEQSYRLTSSLKVPDANTTAIWVKTQDANVTIDLNGFTIRGVTVCSGIPISQCTPTGTGVGIKGAGAVRVRNGFVTQMGSHGVELAYSGRVEDVRLLLNGGDGVRCGEGCTVRGVEATSNGAGGIALIGVESLVTECLANGNAFAGIVVGAGVVVDSIASRNGQGGLSLGPQVSYRGNQLSTANTFPSVAGGQATGGSVCSDGLCTRTGAKRFYLTPSIHNGAQALGACAGGFHMASLWEIFDTTSLVYDSARGAFADDRGSGPPTNSGWVRTGFDIPPLVPQENLVQAGVATCAVWTSASSQLRGTSARLVGNWDPTTYPETRLDPWSATAETCNSILRVWCVED
jgi:hypothetical protein